LTIDRPHHVWAMAITYLPMRKGFVYLAAVLDGGTRKVLSWGLSNTLTTAVCLDAVEAAIRRYGPPELFNRDPGSPFTSQALVALMQRHGIRFSMDGKGRWVDNVFVERVWKSVKYADVYLPADDSVEQARQGLECYFSWYNQRRPHASLDGQTPDTVYFSSLPLKQAA
jgi:putative transposase